MNKIIIAYNNRLSWYSTLVLDEAGMAAIVDCVDNFCSEILGSDTQPEYYHWPEDRFKLKSECSGHENYTDTIQEIEYIEAMA